MPDIEKIKTRLAKLLRLSEDGAASEGEIENALNAAAQIMAKHQLTRDDIDHSEDSSDPYAKMRMNRKPCLCKSSKATTWELILASFVKKLIGSVDLYKHRVKVLAVANGSPWATGLFFYGPEDDVEESCELFEELQDTISVMAIAKWGGFYQGDGAAYAEGFATGLIEKLIKETQKLKNQDEQTNALILKSESSSLAVINHARNWLESTYGVKITRRKENRGSNGSSFARQDGRNDAKNYNVKRPGVRRKIS